jgi:oxygen-dependent protoporphyrinogen oxidase
MRAVVVGGGISGLAAAYRLAEHGADVVLVEQSRELGGKLRTVALAGAPAEAAAEQFLVRDPDGGPSAAVRLARAVGLGDELVNPRPLGAAVALAGDLRAIPAGTLMGVPAEPADLDGLAHVAAERDRDGGHPVLAPGEDVAVGALVRRRLGDEVADRLVDPLLGGVYAGRADDLSLAATVPALATTARRSHTLMSAVRAALASRPAGGGPVFTAPVRGMGSLVAAVATRLSTVDIRLGLPVRAVSPAGSGWRVAVGSTRSADVLAADAVVLAVPGRPAARLLSTVDFLDYASVALVTLVLPEVELPSLTGFLVPAVEGRAVKAATFFDRKWSHHARPGLTVVRCSLGRYGDPRVLQMPDDALAALAHGDLGALLGQPLPAPVEAVVHRWGGALPQYPPGHLDRVTALRATLPPTLALAGAAYDGVGIPACIRSGWAAADRILQGWGA